MHKYPTENYLLKFFAVDSILGCFVSLWWDGDTNRDRKFFTFLGWHRFLIRITSAEAHYYKFDENDPENFPAKVLFTMVLKDFDKDLLVASREERFHPLYRPAFTSFRGQVFVYGRHPDSGVGFSGHYGRLFCLGFLY